MLFINTPECRLRTKMTKLKNKQKTSQKESRKTEKNYRINIFRKQNKQK
jgi:hypothetical protein